MLRKSTLAALGASLVALAFASSSALADATPGGKPGADVESLSRHLAALEREEHGLEQTLAKDERELRMLRQRVVARGRAYYRLSRGGPQNDGWFEHAIRVERLRQSLLGDLNDARALTQRRREQSERLATVRERKAPLARESQNLEQMKSALLSQEERERAFAQAFSQTHDVGHTAIYGAGLGPDARSDGSFKDMRGRLPFPLPGRTEVEPVRRKYADGPGLVMHAPAGTVVRSVFDGFVSFADEYPDYGKTIIVDHGGGYFTVSANLGTIDVKVGESVAAGSRLGILGGMTGRSELYFEVRRGSETLAPGEWFGI
jgi:septal ring factor EnvC (AmiA/AmiB activator)